MEREAIEIAVLHLEGEAKDCWFGHLKREREIVYVDLTQSLIEENGDTFHREISCR